MFRKEKETYDKEEDVSISACLLTGVDDRLCKSQSTQEISTDSSEVTTESIPESIPETNTSEADSEVPVTIKIANYAVLEKGTRNSGRM